jgi:branched-chain amino acid aminotransferase
MINCLEINLLFAPLSLCFFVFVFFLAYCKPGTWIVRFQSIALRTRSEIYNVKLNQVEERAIPLDELMDADEVFCTGTAVGVAPVGTITYQDRR